MDQNVKRVLDCLNKHKLRATYTSVQSYLGYPVQDRINWSELLGEKIPYTSWIVEKRTGLPVGFAQSNLHPDLQTTTQILTKGRQIKELLSETEGVEVVDCHGNNCAVICKKCRKTYCVSSFLNKGVRHCPHCGETQAIYKEVQAQWKLIHPEPTIRNEQTATRLTFKQKWLGRDVWVTFCEHGTTYRYPHDKVLQALIDQLGIIKGTASWEAPNGYYNIPRLSEDQMKILQQYIIASSSPAVHAIKGDIVIKGPELANAAILFLCSGFNRRIITWHDMIEAWPFSLADLSPAPWKNNADTILKLHRGAGKLKYVYIFANPKEQKGFADTATLQAAACRALKTLQELGCKSVAFIHMPLRTKEQDRKAALSLIEVLKSSSNPMKNSYLVDLNNDFKSLFDAL